MHAAQRIAGLIMVELGNGANRFPSTRGVAVLTRDGEGAVRTMRAFRDLSTHALRESRKSNDQNQNQSQF